MLRDSRHSKPMQLRIEKILARQSCLSVAAAPRSSGCSTAFVAFDCLDARAVLLKPEVESANLGLHEPFPHLAATNGTVAVGRIRTNRDKNVNWTILSDGGIQWPVQVTDDAFLSSAACRFLLTLPQLKKYLQCALHRHLRVPLDKELRSTAVLYEIGQTTYDLTF